MGIFSYIVFILLSLVGYSAGVTKRAGKSEALEPELRDISIVLLIWAVAIFSRLRFDLNKWILIFLGVFISFIVGFAVQRIRMPKRPLTPVNIKPPTDPLQQQEKSSLRKNWKAFSREMGGFQSRMLLSFIFFTLIAPFALIVKIFLDPLNIKIHKAEIHWLERKEISSNLEDYKRQF